MSDIKYAIRGLRRSPGFAITAVLSLALGIGANVTIYTVANAFLQRIVPGAADPDRLARVYRGNHSPLQYADLAYVRANNAVFTEVAGEDLMPVALANGEMTERIQGALVTTGYFEMLGVRAQVGRLFGAADSAFAGGVVISDVLWRGRFGGESSIVGREIRVNDHPFTIIGVAPPEFLSSIPLWRAEIWFPPASTQALLGAPLERLGSSLYITARLRPGVSTQLASAELAAIAARLVASDPVEYRNFTLRADHARGITAELRGPAVAATGFLMFVVGLVLLIACANVANLLLARAAGRRREISVRIAMGARRARLVRQLLTESALLALAAGALGVIAASWLADLLARFVTMRSPEPINLSFEPDARVLAFTFVVSALTTVLFGLLPALRATSLDILPALREDAPQTSGRSRLRSTLIGTQVALCTVLLACATLFLRSLANTRVIDPGFDASGVVDVAVDISSRNLEARAGARFYESLLDRSRALPGVRAATVAALVPLGGSNMQSGMWVDGKPAEGPRAPFMPYFNVVGSDYFQTLGIALVSGRGFTATDAFGSPEVVVVNEELARRLWPGQSALGKRISMDSATGPWRTVVGVARTTKYNTLGEDPREFLYLPFAQNYRTEMILHARADGETLALRRALPALVRGLDPQLPTATAKLLADDMRIALLPAQLGASLLGAFGMLALLLASVGIYGVASHGVAQRTRELGIRAALGATAHDVMRMILGQSLRVVLVGAVVGIAAALGVARLIASQLYGVGAADPVTFIGMPVFLIAVAILATLIPARRATRVDPVVALRAE